jgi:hypothetical protein
MSAPSQVVLGEPQCVTLRDAIATRFEIVPPAAAPDQPPRHSSFKAYTRGCLYDAEGVRADLSVRAGGVGGDQAMSIDPDLLPPGQRGGTWLSGRTLYLGTFMNHYGHFITESLSRYWRQEAAGFDHFVAYPFMHDHGEIRVRPFHRYLAGLLDVPLDRMAVLRSQTVFDETDTKHAPRHVVPSDDKPAARAEALGLLAGRLSKGLNLSLPPLDRKTARVALKMLGKNSAKSAE